MLCKEETPSRLQHPPYLTKSTHSVRDRAQRVSLEEENTLTQIGTGELHEDGNDQIELFFRPGPASQVHRIEIDARASLRRKLPRLLLRARRDASREDIEALLSQPNSVSPLPVSKCEDCIAGRR